jgi:hypothetical protein
MKTVNMAIAILVAGTQLSWGALQVAFAPQNPAKLTIPGFASTTGKTKIIEWGCPVDQERRQESSRKMALKNLVSECIEQVSQAAAAKPDVSGVIRASLIAPDVTFQEMADGSRIVNGTIFLQTVVAMNGTAQ